MTERRLFVDMDGVLADFALHYETVFGVAFHDKVDSVDWQAVREHRDFYAGIPPMADMPELWRHIAPLRPIVLTGIPYSVPEAPDNKRGWVRRHLGPDVEVRCCRSSEKWKHAAAGDVLIDDWDKYADKWRKVGGVFVHHTSADATIAALQELKL